MRVFLLALLCCSAFAQERAIDNNFHGWFSYFGDHAFGKSKWGAHLEGQFRRRNGITQWQQLLLRPGVNYQVNDHVMLTLGYAFVRTHPANSSAPPVFDENRIWEQIWVKYRTGKLAWSTRFRWENRFLPDGKSWRYENRTRTWQQATLPLNRRFYVTAYDEFWFYVPPYVASSAFDQNRAYAALGVYLKPGWRFEAGYMNQTLLQRSGRVLDVNHTMVFSIYSTAPFFKK